MWICSSNHKQPTGTNDQIITKTDLMAEESLWRHPATSHSALIVPYAECCQLRCDGEDDIP